MPIGLSVSNISSFCLLLIASLINPSLLINSVYIRSAPFSLHTDLKGGSLTSSIGANSNGNSDNDIVPIFINSNILLPGLILQPGCKFTIHRGAVMQTYLKTK